MDTTIYINDSASVTPFDVGVDSLWDGLISNRTTIKECDRFLVENFQSKKSSHIKIKTSENSIIWSLLEPIKNKIKSWNVDYLILATTKGEIDLLERECILNKSNNVAFNKDVTLLSFLHKLLNYLEIKNGALVSSACVSSNSAIARGCDMINANRASEVAVIGIDIVSLFVFSGFSALQALSTDNDSLTPAKPFDANRDGLIIGEACGAILLSKKPRITNGGLTGKIIGWGSASDANHVTGPSRDGAGLASAISQAMNMTQLTPDQIGAISAHGTATKFNDNMEMLAFQSLFKSPIPTFSIKGSVGHTMGAAGVLETIVSLKALGKAIIPGTVGFSSSDENFNQWVSSSAQEIKNNYILNTNSGFGGINGALILTK